MRSRVVFFPALLLGSVLLASCQTTSIGVADGKGVPTGVDIVAQDDDAVALLESAGVDVNALAARLPEGTQLRLRVNRRGDGDRDVEVMREQEIGEYEDRDSLLRAIEASIMSANRNIGNEAAFGLDLGQMEDGLLQLEAAPTTAVQKEVLSPARESSIRRPLIPAPNRANRNATPTPKPRPAVAEGGQIPQAQVTPGLLDASAFTRRNVVQFEDEILFGQSSIMQR